MCLGGLGVGFAWLCSMQVMFLKALSSLLDINVLLRQRKGWGCVCFASSQVHSCQGTIGHLKALPALWKMVLIEGFVHPLTLGSAFYEPVSLIALHGSSVPWWWLPASSSAVLHTALSSLLHFIITVLNSALISPQGLNKINSHCFSREAAHHQLPPSTPLLVFTLDIVHCFQWIKIEHYMFISIQRHWEKYLHEARVFCCFVKSTWRVVFEGVIHSYFWPLMTRFVLGGCSQKRESAKPHLNYRDSLSQNMQWV